MATGTAGDTGRMEIALLATGEMVTSIATIIIVPMVTTITPTAIRITIGLLNNIRKTEMKRGVRF